MTLPDYMLTAPAVFAVGDTYQIFIPFSDAVLVTVRVGSREFYDDCNGVLRSNTLMHKVTLPMAVLDAAREYTVAYRKVIDRKPYFPELEAERTLTLSFRPVPTEGPVRIYHIADAHNLVKEPIAAGRYFEDELNLLVLNGDIPNHSGRIENFNAIYEIAGGVTGGRCPVVFARGNHDTRGIHAEDMPQYIPLGEGKTYYTFRAGSVWGVVLDCGEDKWDDDVEYGGTICFHAFRQAETDFLRRIIDRAAVEYAAPGVEHRLVISHVDFFKREEAQRFDIEDEIYSEWARLLREDLHPDLMLFGHHHICQVFPVGSSYDDRGQPCPAIIGSAPTLVKFGDPANTFTGCAVTLGADGAEVVFNRETGEVVGKETL